MKARYIISLTALALTMAACTSDDIAKSQSEIDVQKGNSIPFTAVISADAAGTRGLTEASDGKSITAKWEKEEKVALIHGETIDVLDVTYVDADGNATITGTINNAVNDESVYVVYVGHQHVNMSNYVSKLQSSYQAWKVEWPDATAIPTALMSDPVNSLLGTQDGTLETISNKHDYRFARATLAVSDGKATFSDAVSLSEKYAIWKLNLTTNGTTALNASNFVMKVDGEVFTTVDLGTETKNVFYIAFLASPSSTYSFEATAGDNTYTCTPAISGDLAVGKFYTSTLTMSESDSSNQYLVFNEEGEVAETPAIGDATAVASSEESVTWSGKYVVSSDVTINGDITLTGDVDLILKDGASLTVKGHFENPQDESSNWDYHYSINIYGQNESTGELIVIDDDINVKAHNLNIHGGVITVIGGGVMQGLETSGTLNVYNGTVNTAGAVNGIYLFGDMNVYGGDVTATSTGGNGIECTGTITVNNGTFTVTGGENDGAIAITAEATINIASGLTYYEGDEMPDTSSGGTEGEATTNCTKRYVVIK